MIEQERSAERLDLARQLREKRDGLLKQIEDIDGVIESLENPKIRKHHARRYASIPSLCTAMVIAVMHFERPADPLELLKELESGMFGFSAEESQAARLLNMARAYKQDGKNRIEIVEGKYQLSKP